MPEQTDAPLLPVEEALRQILCLAKAVTETEEVALADAAGRVLAEDVSATADVPPTANSAMDGFALDSTDTATQKRAEAGEALKISQRIPAGKPARPLAPGTLARIFTGGELPEGADAVVIQEDCRYSEDSAEVFAWPYSGQHTRPRGQDIQKGALLLQRGSCLAPWDLGLLASVGLAGIRVLRRVKVALFATGDELQLPGQPLAAGQIYNSSTYTLAALLQETGCELLGAELIRDTKEATRTALQKAAAEADLILTSGGVSVGDEDHVRAAIEEIGQISVRRLAIRPGKPLAVGQARGVPVIGLPGNPVSSFVTFVIFARPFILKMQGRSQVSPLSLHLPAAETLTAGSRREYLRVRIQDGRVTAYGNQGSGILSSVAWADGLAVVPEGTEIQPGEKVEVLLLSQLRHQETASA